MDNNTKRSTTIDVDKKVVDVTRNTKTSKGGKQYANHWVLDYQNVTDAQLLSLATRGIVIDLQRQFRDANPSERDKLMEQTIDVGAFLATQHKRAPVDPREAALKYLRGLTTKERKTAIAEASA